MRRYTRKLKKINSKVLLVVFFITMFLFGTSYAILAQELTLTGTVKMKIEDEGTDLTITDFNTSIAPIYTQYLFNIIPISGYKVVGITIQNTLSRTINNWTVEFTSSRTAETTKPTNNQLSAYLGAQYAYDSITNSNGKVIVTGSDTLAPGDTKTVYVFFSTNLLNNNITFSDERAFYTPNRGRSINTRANTKSLNLTKEANTIKYDIYETKEFAVLICYDTTIVADKLYNTIMYVFIGNNTGKDISNIKFDVKYRNSNLSNLLASSINIVENNDSGASFISNDIIGNVSCKGYIVTGLKTYGGFDGMEITNASYSLSDGNVVIDGPDNNTETINNNNDNNNNDNNNNSNKDDNNDTLDSKYTDEENNNLSNTIVENKTIETSTNTVDNENSNYQNSNNENTISNESSTNEKTSKETTDEVNHTENESELKETITNESSTEENGL